MGCGFFYDMTRGHVEHACRTCKFEEYEYSEYPCSKCDRKGNGCMWIPKVI